MTIKYRLCISLIFLFSSSITYAEIFTWVDEDGKTHYSDRQRNQGESEAEKMEVDSPNILATYEPREKEDLEKEDSKKEGKAKKTSKNIEQNTQAAWQGEGADTDTKKCALATAIAEGGAKHTNGASIDKHDLEVAQRDMSKFCH